MILQLPKSQFSRFPAPTFFTYYIYPHHTHQNFPLFNISFKSINITKKKKKKVCPTNKLLGLELRFD